MTPVDLAAAIAQKEESWDPPGRPGFAAAPERFRQSVGRGCPASAGLLLPFPCSSETSVGAGFRNAWQSGPRASWPGGAVVVGFYERAPGGGSLMGQGSAALMSEQVRAGELRFAAGRGYGGSTQHAGHTSIGGIVILRGRLGRRARDRSEER